ncbi:hypothetical protein D3C73_1597640 [compost metagenome]
MIEILNAIIKGFASVVGGLVSILPSSPFTWDLGALGAYMPVINYFIPFQAMATMMGTYLVAVGLWYVVRWALRLIQYID